VFSIRISLFLAFGATVISATVGTVLGFLAAHFRRWVEQIVLMLADFQASMPFLILALSVLAFFGSSLPLLVGLMGSSAGSVTRVFRADLPFRRTPKAMPQPFASWARDRRGSHQAHPAEHRLYVDRLDDPRVS
jgi:ABC-type dipeptide/oligopeptide/nickel transport system permease component